MLYCHSFFIQWLKMMHQNITDQEVEEMLSCHFRKWFQDFVRILYFLSMYVVYNRCYVS